MNSFRVRVLLIATSFLIVSTGFAEPGLTFDEFQTLSAELSQKVNLFQRIWASDAEAEFFGGTTRDFLYWVRGQFRDLKTRDEVDARIALLRARPSIDVREFIIGDSDVDVALKNGASPVHPKEFGVRKIDAINTSRFDPNSEMGRNEINQGYIPVEKIRLNKSGFVHWNGFGDGLKEIYDGKITAHFATPNQFENTYYAARKLNHPVLLALRYLRNVAVHYHQTHGSGFPDREKLNAIMDPKSRAGAFAAIEAARELGALRDHLKNEPFQRWLNMTVHKAYRAYTNPTATHLLFQEMKVDELVRQYSNDIEPINQYLFAKHRDPKIIEENFRKYGVTPEKLFTDPATITKNLEVFHGTPEESRFQNILRQGILGSIVGAAGTGLYAVPEEHIATAKTYAAGDENRIVKFKLDPNARVIDIMKEPGRSLFATSGMTHDQFAEAFGADLLVYPLSPVAFVIKNSSVLSRPVGMTRAVVTFEKMLEIAAGCHTLDEFRSLIRVLVGNNFTTREVDGLVKSMPIVKKHPELAKVVTELGDSSLETSLRERLISIFGPLEILSRLEKTNEREFRREAKKVKKKLVTELTNLNAELARQDTKLSPARAEAIALMFSDPNSPKTTALLNESALKVVNSYSPFWNAVKAKLMVMHPIAAMSTLVFGSASVGSLVMNGEAPANLLGMWALTSIPWYVIDGGRLFKDAAKMQTEFPLKQESARNLASAIEGRCKVLGLLATGK